MGESDFGLTPNVWRPSEVPYPGVGSDTVRQAGADPLSPFSKEFISIPITISASTLYQVEHGLGGVPKFSHVVIRCISPDLGYAVGEEIPADGLILDGTGYNGGVYVAWGARYVYAQTTTRLLAINPAVYATGTDLTFSRWNIIVKAWA